MGQFGYTVFSVGMELTPSGDRHIAGILNGGLCVWTSG